MFGPVPDREASGKWPEATGVADQSRMAEVAAEYARSEAKARAWGENPGNKAMLDEVMAVLTRHAGPQLRGTGKVLEIGCGTGTWLSRLARAGVAEERLFGIDLLEERLAEARTRVPGATLAVGNARSLEFPDATFSLVLLFVVLSSLPDREAEADALREARRVTAPGGVLAVYDMRVPSPNPHVRRVGKRWLRGNLGPGTELHSLTVLPPLARRAPRLYPLAARVPLLRSHWMAIDRR
jgi:SAM-dependent methyltransferase